jgi:L-histidine N-alpha-methyltransferase
MAQDISASVSEDRFALHDLVRGDARSTFAADVRAGLQAESKYLLPKYFYDPLGSELFDAICLLPEYYLTRAENEILSSYADEIVSSIPGRKTLLELGSGSASKTRLLIEALLRRQRRLDYIPVDISASALETSSRVLLQSYPEIQIDAYASDYYSGLEHLKGRLPRLTLALFLGSNIGNFDVEESKRFLRALRGVLSEGDALLLGADLKKDRSILQAAYDDALGVTAAFNLNLLARINREFGADFDLRAFRHVANYNEEAGCVQVFLESLREQVVRVEALDLDIQIGKGERLHTENSYKYDLEQLSELADATGFALKRSWLDKQGRFSSNLFVAAGEGS